MKKRVYRKGYRFLRLEPDKGYYGRQLWLPKKYVNLKSIKAALEFPVMQNGELVYHQVWDERKDHIIVPREFLSYDKYSTLPFKIISNRPAIYKRFNCTSLVELDLKNPNRTVQRDAYESMIRAKRGILNLACGLGKTCVALHYIAYRKVNTLIIVNNTTLIDQWRERIRQFLRFPYSIGLIQGPPEKWVWYKPGITLAMIQSLAKHKDKIPLGMIRHFGLIIFDEVHHLSAPIFSQTAPLFYGDRHGLTATDKREDGLEAIYRYHIGPTYYKNLMQDLTPRIYFQQCETTFRLNAPNVFTETHDKVGRLSIPKLRNYLGSLPEVNKLIVDKLQEPIKEDRHILVLSHSVNQLRMLHEMVDDSGLCTGSEKPEQRLVTLRTKRVSFGTLQLVKEALDEATLDTLFFLTPFGSNDIIEGGANTLQQGMGRILRVLTKKKTPVVVFFDYVYINKLHRMCNKLKKLIKTWPTEQGGPLTYTVIKP